jgi:cytidine deaminase
MHKETTEELVEEARKARTFALAPYSGFQVGAALLTADGKIFRGSNVESSSYGLTMCAERVALFKALTEGAREFVAMALTAGTEDFVPPCGACRQLLWDYASNIEVLLVNAAGEVKRLPLATLIPEAFDNHLLKTG